MSTCNFNACVYIQVSFGCVLNDTTMTKAVRVTNNSVVDCAFSWSFLEDVDEGRLSATARRPYIPVNQIFDILPIRSFLRPGESEEVRAWGMYVVTRATVSD